MFELIIEFSELVAQVAEEQGISIENGVVSHDHIHLFVNIPPHTKVSEFVQKAKGRSSRRIQQEFPELRKRYWGKRMWGRGYFSATSGNITDEMINDYINNHSDAHDGKAREKIRLE